MSNVEILFVVNVAAQFILLAGAVWCIGFPARRIYPMTTRTRWVSGMWALFYFVFASNFALAVFDWNTWHVVGWSRFVLGLPLIALGAGGLTWGILTLGATNTTGVKVDFVRSGPYRFSLNPQYVSDMALFLGVAVIANSELATVSHLLTVLIFVVAPLAEEPWLEVQYGDDYRRYRAEVSRFL